MKRPHNWFGRVLVLECRQCAVPMAMVGYHHYPELTEYWVPGDIVAVESAVDSKPDVELEIKGLSGAVVVVVGDRAPTWDVVCRKGHPNRLKKATAQSWLNDDTPTDKSGFLPKRL